MGTSASSKGPGGGVPLVPPWVPPLPGPPAAPAGGPAPQTGTPIPGQVAPTAPANPAAAPVPATPLAPARRFGAARTSLGSYGRSGNHNDLKAGLGHYVRSGYGGSAQAARRMGGTARTAGALYGVFSALRSGQAPTDAPGINPATLVGRPAREVMDAIADAIRPIDGTQDAEASRQAMDGAVADLLGRFPDADLTTLDQSQIEMMLERYAARDLCHRIELDVGKSITSKAPDPATAVRRLEDMRQYIAAEIAAQFAQHRQGGQQLTGSNVAALVASVLQATLSVFEDYV